MSLGTLWLTYLLLYGLAIKKHCVIGGRVSFSIEMGADTVGWVFFYMFGR